jgi:aldehyde dehydrogenase (NAD+)
MSRDDRDRLYIDGQWVRPNGTGTIDVINAATEEVMGCVPDGTADDVDRAVQAARRAFAGWSVTEPEERADALRRITEGLQGRMMELPPSSPRRSACRSTWRCSSRRGCPS